MAPSDFSTTYNEQDTTHDVQVPVRSGLRVTVPAGLRGAAPAPPVTNPLDFYEWPNWLTKAERAAGKDIRTTLHKPTKAEPTIANLADYTPGTDSGSPDTAPRKLTDSEWVDIVQKNRGDAETSACTSKLFLGQDLNQLTWGWAYYGITAQRAGLVPTTKQGSPAEHTLEWAQGLVWDELTAEGGYASINAYDPGKLTWGQGWAMSGGPAGLPGLMNRVWRNEGLRKAFLEHGIAWDTGTGRFKVINPDGYMETGPSALELLIGTRSLLAVFIKLGESAAHQQALIDAEYEQLCNTQVGKVPKVVYENREARLIQIMAHVGHAWGGQMWKYTSTTNIHDFLMAWGAGGWMERGSGARTRASGQILINLKTWGKGIAWTDAISKVCPSPVGNFTDEDIDNPANKVYFDGLLAIWNPEQKGYHFYPRLPNYVVADEELYNWVSTWAGYNMTDLLAAAQELGVKAKTFRDTYPSSERTNREYGPRPRVALDAAAIKKDGAKRAERDRLYADPAYKALTEPQMNEIRKFLGDSPITKGPWDYWDAGKPKEFFDNSHYYSMDALLSTYGARGYAGADQLRVKYEELNKYLGWRPWIAIMTVLNRNGGQAASWIVTHGGYRPLGKDQRRAIRKTLGLPYSDDVLDAEATG